MGYRISATEYSRDEKKRALEELAGHLLRARDGKTRGLQRHGEIIKLANELRAVEHLIEEELDSDDEDDSGAEAVCMMTAVQCDRRV